MNKIFAVLIFVVCAAAHAAAQTDLQKLIDTEKSFAAASDARGMKRAFLEFLADDAVMFAPNVVNGKEYFRARPDDAPATLSWYPIFADVSSNGALGYTTGRGEYRAKGAADEQVFYSDFATVWRRESNGNYRAVLDIGVSHGKPAAADRTVSSPPDAERFSGTAKTPAAQFVNRFYDAATISGLEKAYKKFAAEDARFLREGKFPVLGRADAPIEPKKTKITFGKRMTLQSADDLAYSVTTYEIKDAAGKTTEKGNSVQIWKLKRDGEWRIVLDVLASV